MINCLVEELGQASTTLNLHSCERKKYQSRNENIWLLPDVMLVVRMANITRNLKGAEETKARNLRLVLGMRGTGGASAGGAGDKPSDSIFGCSAGLDSWFFGPFGPMIQHHSSWSLRFPLNSTVTIGPASWLLHHWLLQLPPQQRRP